MKTEPIVDYELAAKKYLPDEIKLLFIAESPPDPRGKKPRYFYFEELPRHEHLFINLLKVVLRKDIPETTRELTARKREFLSQFRDSGFFLIDVCDYPIDSLREKERKKHIEENFETLLKKLKTIVKSQTKIVLIKKNIYEILGPKLKQEGYNILNTEALPFPCRGHQKAFREKLAKTLNLP